MLKVLTGLFVLGLVAYIVSMLTPPKDALGSIVPGWGDPYRQRKMIRDEAEQDEDFGWFV